MSPDNETSKRRPEVPDRIEELPRLARGILNLVNHTLRLGATLDKKDTLIYDLYSEVFGDWVSIRRLGTSLTENGHPLALEARAHVAVIQWHINQILMYIQTGSVDGDSEYELLLDAVEGIWRDDRPVRYARAKDSVGSSLELIAGKMIAEFEKEGMSVTQVPLPPTVKMADDIIREANGKGKGITGKEIIEEFNTRLPEESKDISPMDQSRLTKAIVPKLKSLRGLKNKRDRGGYFYPEYFRSSE